MKNFNRILKMVLICFLTVSTITSCKKGSVTTPPELPIVTNVQPKNPKPGDVVNISGTGFGTTATDVKVTIGSQIITITSVTATEIKFTLPTGITAGDIAVAIKNIIASNIDPQKATITPQQTVLPVATITSINPTSGKVGDLVTITGTNFNTTLANDVVKFNGIATTVIAATATSLTVNVPATATTGVVTLSVLGAAAISGSSFTVNSSNGGSTGSAVPYIVSVGGTATFSKIASASSEIGAMVVDKKNNILYYSDFGGAPYFATYKGTLYKVKLDGSAPVVVTTDPRITAIQNIAIDPANGNIVVESRLDAVGLSADIYNINVATSAITVVSKNVNIGGSGNGFRYIDTKGNYWLSYGQKLNLTTGNFDRNASFAFDGTSQSLFMGDNIYVSDWDHSKALDMAFFKYNLSTLVSSVTDFTLKGLFSADDPSWAAGTNYGSNADLSTRIAIDDHENVNVIYPFKGDAISKFSEYYVVRKTKNGAGGASTLITKFYIKLFSDPSTPPLVGYTDLINGSDIKFQSDASGNLYIKGNRNDIIKITP